jgi:hypothetical protein
MRPSAIKRDFFERNDDAYGRFQTGFEDRDEGDKCRIYNIWTQGRAQWLGFVRLAMDIEQYPKETLVLINTEFVWVRPSCRGHKISSRVAGLAAGVAYSWMAREMPRGAPKPWILIDSSTGKNRLGEFYVTKFKKGLKAYSADRIFDTRTIRVEKEKRRAGRG